MEISELIARIERIEVVYRIQRIKPIELHGTPPQDKRGGAVTTTSGCPYFCTLLGTEATLAEGSPEATGSGSGSAAMAGQRKVPNS